MYITKNIVLTGGASGIGFELLKRLLSERHQVAVITRTESQLDELKNNFPSNNLKVFIANLSSQSDILKIVKKIMEEFPKVDILFNNAGVMLGKTIKSNQGNEMHYEVNTLAPYLLTLQLKSALAQSSDPLVLNTSTDGLQYASNINVRDVVTPREKQGTLTLYLNSKLASMLLLNHLSEQLKVRVINASPGGNKTKLSKGDGMAIWMKPLVMLLYKNPDHGAKLLYQAAFDQQNLSKTQIYLQNNLEQKLRCSITEEQIQELLSGIKISLNNG